MGWTKKDDQVFVEALIFLLNGTSTICFHTCQGDPTILAIEVLEVEDEAYI
ncbi:hypothetical protein ARALYDRAFT_893284 [Arabidopsis lyrata subsp. lyrata]|uniref:Uncharacterized protein n=1 Tax=Arabidopsis lyrata subsp. lyrata TaxID=81972 RepID=D7KUU9_ARALL|nr:hypothetical protein ARALYDRAFT_893284 [Arabidopsis lyrata subsp. lyrata]